MDNDKLYRLLDDFRRKPTEDECFEFKEAKNQYDFTKIGKYFSALSNEANLKGLKHAWLIFGIENKSRKVIGTTYRQSHSNLQSLKKDIADKTTNRISFIDIYPLEYQGERVIMFEIPAAPRGIPVAFEGHYYGRDHESLVGLNIEKIERIRQQGITDDWSAQIVENASIQDLDPAAIKKAREEYFKKYPRQEQEGTAWSDETFLNKAKISIGGKITNAALLLLGKEDASTLLLPAQAKISWIYKENNIEKDYEHLGIPFINVPDKVLEKIRNLTYRYLPDATLFPTEIKTYDNYVIREALHNCIAHQDYRLRGRISVVEKHNEELVFSNEGSFLPGSVERVIEQDAPQNIYRNPFLCNAMVNLNMIDTIGSGIKKMFIAQRNRFFPLPEYDLSDPQRVMVSITGRIWDVNYTRLLMEKSNLDLKTVILLDSVQKGKPLTDREIQILRKDNLIEGRKPHIFIAKEIADKTGEKASYIRNKGFDDKYYKDLIINFLAKYGEGSRSEIEDLILDKLPQSLSEQSKSHKIKNMIQSLKNQDKIKLKKGRKWVLV